MITINSFHLHPHRKQKISFGKALVGQQRDIGENDVNNDPNVLRDEIFEQELLT